MRFVATLIGPAPGSLTEAQTVSVRRALSSLGASVAMIPALYVLLGSAGAAYGTVSSAIIIFKHRENIDRLRAGTESVLPLFGRGRSAS